MMRNKLVSIALSVAVAFGLWLYVINSVSPGSKQVYYDIPVVMDGEAVLNERGLMITDVSDTAVTLELSGNRSDLSKVNKGNITIKADLSRIYEPGKNIQLNYTHSFPGNVASNAFVVESKTPSYITVTVENRVAKDVPVEVRWNGSAAEGFMTDRENRVLDYPFVTVVGPSSVVEQIAKAVIEVDLTDRRETISESFVYTLCDAGDAPVDAQLITTNAQEIHLDVKIHRVKDVTLTYTLVPGGGAGTDNAEVTLSAETILVSGHESALDKLGSELNLGTVNLGEIAQDTDLVFAVVLPENVNNLSGITEVTASVHLKGLATREITVEQIQTLHVPEGMEAQIYTEKLTMTVRGAAAQVTKLTAEEITVTVDFTDAEPGTSTYKATIAFADGYDTVGVFRADPVSAAVTEKQ